LNLNKEQIYGNLPYGLLSLSNYDTTKNMLMAGCSDGFLRVFQIPELGEKCDAKPVYEKSFGEKLILHHFYNMDTRFACVGMNDGSIGFIKNFNGTVESTRILLNFMQN